MTTLKELIQERKQALGLSYRQLGQRAKAAGAKVEPNWSHYTTRPLTEFPKTKTIYALAAALEVDVDEVIDAALESIGLRTQPFQPLVQPGERWIVVFADDLTADDQEMLRKRITETVVDLRHHRKSG